MYILVLFPLEKTNEWYFQIPERFNGITFQAPEEEKREPFQTPEETETVLLVKCPKTQCKSLPSFMTEPGKRYILLMHKT